MPRDNKASAGSAISTVISILEGLDDETRGRVLSAVGSYFNVDLSSVSQPRPIQSPVSFTHGTTPGLGFAKENAPTPKLFLMEKQPRTDVERIACLAYYLAHYRDTPQFKTLDLGKLNTEAAQPKFSNAAYTVNNAQKMGYLVPGTKGQRQLSGPGERFVAALPDRSAAREALEASLPRRKTKKR